MSTFRTLLVGAALAWTAAVHAFPTKPVRIVVGFPAGGPLDQHARLLTDKLQAVLGQQCMFVFDVLGRRQRLLHVEMVAPAGEFDAIVAHLFDERGQRGEGEVGPLAGEQGDWTWHGICFRRVEGKGRGRRTKGQGPMAKCREPM